MAFCLFLVFIAGCATQRGSTRAGKTEENMGSGTSKDGNPGGGLGSFDFVPTGQNLLSDDSARIAVRRLETDPLAGDAATLRRRLFEWLLASERLHDFDASTSPVDDLQRTPYPYKAELLMQFLFGGAAWRVGGAEGGDLAAQQEAGIKSMIAAYRNIAQLEPEQRDSFLDRLDELRRTGDLRRYIERKHRGERQ